METTKKHILIVEDNEDILEMLEAILRRQQYQVSTRPDGNHLELVIEEIHPDVIILDMLLSGVDGTVLCKRLKENPSTQQIPVVMISASNQGLEKSEACGADFFIAKPFEMKELISVVSKAFGFVDYGDQKNG
jgi:DNA-binding response OmpR family regulator